MVTEQQIGPGSEPTLRDLREALITVYGTDFGIHNPTWISQVHRHDAPGGGLPRWDGCYLPATPRTCTTRRADRASASACRMP